MDSLTTFICSCFLSAIFVHTTAGWSRYCIPESESRGTNLLVGVNLKEIKCINEDCRCRLYREPVAFRWMVKYKIPSEGWIILNLIQNMTHGTDLYRDLSPTMDVYPIPTTGRPEETSNYRRLYFSLSTNSSFEGEASFSIYVDNSDSSPIIITCDENVLEELFTGCKNWSTAPSTTLTTVATVGTMNDSVVTDPTSIAASSVGSASASTASSAISAVPRDTTTVSLVTKDGVFTNFTSTQGGATSSVEKERAGDDSDGDELPLTAIIGGVIGGIVLLAIVLIIIIWRRRKNNETRAARRELKFASLKRIVRPSDGPPSPPVVTNPMDISQDGLNHGRANTYNLVNPTSQNNASTALLNHGGHNDYEKMDLPSPTSTDYYDDPNSNYAAVDDGRQGGNINRTSSFKPTQEYTKGIIHRAGDGPSPSVGNGTFLEEGGGFNGMCGPINPDVVYSHVVRKDPSRGSVPMFADNELYGPSSY